MKLPSLLLLVLISGYACVTNAQTANLRARVDSFYSSGEFDSALVYARRLAELEADNPSGWYRMAYLFSLNGQVDSSLAWLDNSITHGFLDYLHFELDSDLNAVRSDPRYRTIIERARKEALRAADQKALLILEGEWTPLVLESDNALPKVEAELSFDQSALLIRATVHDAHFKDGDRSWRYGDGFTVNFALPGDDSSGYTNRFDAFGFSRELGRPVSVLVNRDGTYFLRRLDDMPPRIEIDTISMTARYYIRIPWARLFPFHPLLNPRAGVNIRYTSQADDGDRIRLTYLDNVYFDSERTPLRRFAPVSFVYREASPLTFAGRLGSRLTTEDAGQVSFSVWSPVQMKLSIQLSVRDQTGKQVWTGTAGGKIPAGRTMISSSFQLPPDPGSYRVRAAIPDSLVWEESLYRYEARNLGGIRTLVDRPSADGESLEHASSAEALRYRTDALNERIRIFTDRSDLEALRRDIEDVSSLARMFESGGTIYGRRGYLLSAFHSSLDSSLQPFSIVFPEGYDRSKRYRLYVGLHGSGVDEVSFALATAQNVRDPNAIILAPRGRDLSGWWRGKDELDVAQLVENIKAMLPIEKTLCLGFSMGGYGTWRMSMLHPELFDAAAIISGTPVPPGRLEQGDDLRTHIGGGRELSYIVFHGTEDRSLPIDDTDRFVEMLKDAAYDVRYIRIQGAGHGNMDVGRQFGQWMEEKFLKRAD